MTRQWTLLNYDMVPEVGIEPTWAQGPLDFESSASTCFTTPASAAIITAEPIWLSSGFLLKQERLLQWYNKFFSQAVTLRILVASDCGERFLH